MLTVYGIESPRQEWDPSLRSMVDQFHEIMFYVCGCLEGGFHCKKLAKFKELVDEYPQVDFCGRIQDPENANFVIVPLVEAAKKRCLSVIAFLIGKGADVNITDKYGTTALMAACGEYSVHLVEYLLKLPETRADLKCSYGQTALMKAALNHGYYGQKFIIMLILSGKSLNEHHKVIMDNNTRHYTAKDYAKTVDYDRCQVALLSLLEVDHNKARQYARDVNSSDLELRRQVCDHLHELYEAEMKTTHKDT